MKKNILLILLITACSFCAYAQDTTFSNPLHSGNIIFSIENKVGLLNRNNQVIIPCKYDALTDVRYNLVKATLNGKVGFIDANNKVKIPFIYDEDTSFSTGARIERQQEYDAAGNVSKISLLVHVDNNYTNFSNGLCAVIKGGKFGFIDTLGNTIIPFQFDGADNFYNNIAIVKVNCKFGAINNTGTLVIPAIYNALVVDQEVEGLYARKDGEFFWVDYEGKRKAERN